MEPRLLPSGFRSARSVGALLALGPAEKLLGARADGVPCCASCPPADKSDKASASSFTYAQQGTPSARRNSATRVCGARTLTHKPRVMGGRRRVGKGGGAGL